MESSFHGEPDDVARVARDRVGEEVARALLAMGVLGGLGGGLSRWLPTHLLSALAGLVRDTDPADYMPATAVTVLATAAAQLIAGAFTARREL